MELLTYLVFDQAKDLVLLKAFSFGRRLRQAEQETQHWKQHREIPILRRLLRRQLPESSWASNKVDQQTVRRQLDYECRGLLPRVQWRQAPMGSELRPTAVHRRRALLCHPARAHRARATVSRQPLQRAAPAVDTRRPGEGSPLTCLKDNQKSDYALH